MMSQVGTAAPVVWVVAVDLERAVPDLAGVAVPEGVAVRLWEVRWGTRGR